MIPSNKKLRKLLRKKKIEQEDYFKIADEFIQLQKKFVTQDTLSTISLWVDMVIYPIYTVISWFWNFSFMSILSIYRSYELWIEWFRFQELKYKIREWTLLVRSVGGPWISSNDAEYHIYVYADAMQRIWTSKQNKNRP